MSHRVAYYRVSTGDQNIEAQRAAMGGSFDQEFSDTGVSGGTLAADRPGFAKLLQAIRKGDTLCVYAVDRLGRDALDVQGTVQTLIDRGVIVDVHGLGKIEGDIGKLILAVLAQVAEMERNRITERCNAGREAARASLAATGRTHKGKHGLGRKPVYLANEKAIGTPDKIAAWRRANNASIADTARHFGVSTATVKRYCAAS
ncbi:recombinase family protein [Sphingopyxis sp. MWB1]|uniref:recombinase family protein n=1 Tax=Sphingopyxis sp. MWB1 TaxID=1537715 RepID=UPI00051A3BE4|nr:recombinase family protein [Sphingopyxis sp. MWB1]